MQLLRFFTAGNVDDGKSTLIGRLLYDSNSISTDIIETLTKNVASGGASSINLAQLTDGLRAEREQGITIDVAYKYFTTDKRKFIIADTPGHFEYTRNMFTGASKADVALILIDAKNGITDQTKRHTLIASILNIPEIVVCINKMDLVNFSETVFEEIVSGYQIICDALNFKQVTFIPLCALEGDNVVMKSNHMPWYKGSSLIHFLENTNVLSINSSEPPRFRVQYIINSEDKNYYGIAGTVLSGCYKKGMRVRLPSGVETEISSIESYQKELNSAIKNTPVIFHLKEGTEIKRGDSILPVDDLPKSDLEFTATICWMDHQPYESHNEIILQQDSFSICPKNIELISKINIHTFEHEQTSSIQLNDVCIIKIMFSNPVTFDSYLSNRFYGAFILINKNTNQTVAAGVIH